MPSISVKDAIERWGGDAHLNDPPTFLVCDVCGLFVPTFSTEKHSKWHYYSNTQA